MEIEILKQELKKMSTNLFGSNQRYFVNHNTEKMYIVNQNDNWFVFIKKYEKGILSNDLIELKEYSSEQEAYKDFLQREKKYQSKRIKEYEDKLNDAPIELIVVTGSLGFGGYHLVGDQYIYSMEIIAWCGSDNVIKQGRAKLERKMTSDEKNELQKRIAVDGIYKVKVRTYKNNNKDTIYFYLEEVLEKINHTNLQKILDNRLLPISIADSQLGNIVWDRKTKAFETTYKLWNGQANIRIKVDYIEKLKLHLPIIKKHITWIQNNQEKFFDKIVTNSSINSANEWRSCSINGKPYYEINGKKFENEITREVFINALNKSNCSIILKIQGNDKYFYTMYFSTTQPDLFAGHCIEVNLDVLDDNYKINVIGTIG